jgi:hypothetical protein
LLRSAIDWNEFVKFMANPPPNAFAPPSPRSVPQRSAPSVTSAQPTPPAARAANGGASGGIDLERMKTTFAR